MRLKSILAIVLAIAIVGTSCKKDENNILKLNEGSAIATSIALNISDYEQFQNMIYADLNSVGVEIRNAGAIVSQESATFILAIAENLYSTDTSVYNAFEDYFYIGLSMPQPSDYYSLLSSYQISIIEEIFDSLEFSSSHTNFKEFLNTKFEDVYNNNGVSDSEKDFLLAYIVSYEAALSFMSNNLDIISVHNGGGWWSSWGKCAAGILGGAGLGALTGAGAGSLLPAVGTTIGGIAGGIFGGLAGAATSCD
jgi:hypothetical protein